MRRAHSDVAPGVLEVKEKASRSCAHLTTSESRSERERGCQEGEGMARQAALL